MPRSGLKKVIKDYWTVHTLYILSPAEVALLSKVFYVCTTQFHNRFSLFSMIFHHDFDHAFTMNFYHK